MDQEHDLLEQENNKTNEVWEWTKALAIAISIAFAIRYFLFSPIVVDGESMMPTLEDRERLIVNKIVYSFSQPQRGDIIVFHATENKDWIKRVIGLPGDTIEIKDDVLYINDEIVEEPYLEGAKKMFGGNLTDDVPKTVVSEGHLFVMGDNRPNSRDSRWIGTIPLDSVVGRADLVFWPITHFRLAH